MQNSRDELEAYTSDKRLSSGLLRDGGKVNSDLSTSQTAGHSQDDHLRDGEEVNLGLPTSQVGQASFRASLDVQPQKFWTHSTTWTGGDSSIEVAGDGEEGNVDLFQSLGTPRKGQHGLKESSGRPHCACAGGALMNAKMPKEIQPIGPKVQASRHHKCVTFHDQVEVSLWHQDQCIHGTIHESRCADIFRHWWHLDGQVTQWGDVCTAWGKLQDAGVISHPDHPVADARMSHDSTNGQEMQGTYHMVQTDFQALWWSDVRLLSQEATPNHPDFIATWFLSVDRYNICVRPRRIKFKQSMEFWHFVHACRREWEELLDGRNLHFHLVEGEPGGLPSTRAHVIIIQGDHDTRNAVLFKGRAFPPLYSQRAVLFEGVLLHQLSFGWHNTLLRAQEEVMYVMYISTQMEQRNGWRMMSPW